MSRANPLAIYELGDGADITPDIHNFYASYWSREIRVIIVGGDPEYVGLYGTLGWVRGEWACWVDFDSGQVGYEGESLDGLGTTIDNEDMELRRE